MRPRDVRGRGSPYLTRVNLDLAELASSALMEELRMLSAH